MKSSSTELKVGIFAIIVVIFLTYMTFKVGSLPLIWEKGYRLHAVFSDINGLDEQSRIKVAGVEAGVVDKIRLEEGKARLTLLINPNIKVYKNASVSLRMSGLLGDRYLSLSTGTPDAGVLENNGTIENVIPAADIDMLANKLTAAAEHIGDLTRNLTSTFGEQEQAALRDAIHNLRDVTGNLKSISAENREPLNRIIAQIEDFTEALSEKGPGLVDNMNSVAREFSEKGPKLMDNLNEAATELKSLVGENRYAFKQSMDNIKTFSESASSVAQKLDRGEGTLGKLLQDGELYDSLTKVSQEAGKSLDVVSRLRTFMDFSSEYNTGEGEWKGMFNLTLQPRKDKYYILGVVTDPRGSVETTETTTNGTLTIKEEVKSDIEFSAQFAKRFDDLALRIGLLENTFGLGADYFFHDDRGRIKFDVWDFSAKEAGAERSHAKIGLDYAVFKYFFISGGVDNLLNSNRRGVYVGGGLTFEDEDFKYLFGRSANISLP